MTVRSLITLLIETPMDYTVEIAAGVDPYSDCIYSINCNDKYRHVVIGYSHNNPPRVPQKEAAK